MNKSRTILSAAETRSRMQKNINPITTQHKKLHNNISLNQSLKISHWASNIILIVLMVFLSSNSIQEIRGVVQNDIVVPAMAMKRMEYPVSRSFPSSIYERGRPKIPTQLTDIKIPQVTPLTPSPLDDIKIPEVVPPTSMEVINKSLGNSAISVNNQSLTKYALPNAYYDNLDYSSFQPFMCYTLVTNRSAPAWKVLNSDNAYTDEYGFRRYRLNENQLSINGKDDYVIALGTFYKKKGSAGSRFLVVTSTGMYTAITGDEKSDAHTDKMGMFSSHGKGKAGLIEWIVDQDSGLLPKSILRSGSVTTGPIREIQGKILYIYKID